jgi:hypothetical protein
MSVRSTGKRILAVAIVTAGMVIGSAAVSGGFASAERVGPKTPTVDNVHFSTGTAEGSSTPLVTINGSGFGTLPTPVPAGNPQNYAGSECFGVTPGYDGLDFGTSLYFNDFGAGAFEAGFGQSTGGNCIGLVVWKYSDTQIVFGFGVVYGGTLKINDGDRYQVHVAGVRKVGTVHFPS